MQRPSPPPMRRGRGFTMNSCVFEPDQPRNTTPDLARPRLTPEPRLPARSRIEIIAGLALTGLGLAMILITLIRSL